MVSAQDGYGLGTLGDPAAVLRTTDGGTTWQRVGTLAGSAAWPAIPSPTPRLPLSFWASVSGYAVTSAGGLARTEDGGVHWTPVPVGANDLSGVAFLGDGRFGCVQRNGDDTYLGTRDGGVHWATAPKAVGGPLAYALRVAGSSGWTALLGGMGAPNQAGYTTLAAVVAPAQAWTVYNGGALKRSADGGQRWVETEVRDIVQSVVSFADAHRGMLLTAGGRVLRSTDGGATWTQAAGAPAWVHSRGPLRTSPCTCAPWSPPNSSAAWSWQTRHPGAPAARASWRPSSARCRSCRSISRPHAAIL